MSNRLSEVRTESYLATRLDYKDLGIQVLQVNGIGVSVKHPIIIEATIKRYSRGQRFWLYRQGKNNNRNPIHALTADDLRWVNQVVQDFPHLFTSICGTCTEVDQEEEN